MGDAPVDLGRHHQFHGIQPVLPVADVAATAAYFRDVLGFDLDFLVGDPPTYGRVMKGDRTYGDPVYLRLMKAAPEEIRPSGEIVIHVGHDLDGLYEAYRTRGVALLTPPTTQPWGLRDFMLREPNGHVFRICGYVEQS